MSPLRSTLSCAALFALCACSEPSYKQRADNASASDAGDAGATDDASRLPLRDGDASVRDATSAVDTAVPRDEREDATVPVQEPRAGASDGGSPPVTPVTPMVPEPDVGPSTPVVPAWAESLRGPYASRAYTFRQDEFGTVTRASQISFHNFELAEDGLLLRSKSCAYRATTSLADMRMVDPTNVPERVEHVLFSDTEQRWSTDGLPFQLGFTGTQPSICDGKLGESVPKPAAHVWYSGSRCRCAALDEEPLADDCRVLDPDGDRQPGFTYHLMSTSIFGDADVFGGSNSESHLINGQLRADGTLRANVLAEETNYQFGCLPDGCQNIAVLGKWCPWTFNSIDFVRLTDAAPTCASVLAALSTLFPSAAPDYPTKCFQ
ncbi:MAG: hypothetical protein ABW352_25450 [Polyangiales bacterium]